jgi:DNA repair exonuclease SbcCD ATPase subunit
MPETTSNPRQPESDPSQGPAEPGGVEAKSETRIDRPHVMPSTTESGSIPAGIMAEALAEVSDLDDSATAGMALRTQADELAAYLRARLKELDHRESLLNARSAQLDASFRSAQATLNERQAALAQREQELADRERELDADPQTRSSPEPESEPGSLERRAERLARREAALAALRRELDRVHGQALEMCAAAEYLWKEISSRSDRAALAGALDRVRRLSAGHYRAEHEELAEKKRRLEDVRRRLADENERLRRHEMEFRQWLQERELSLERRAVQLAAKEAKLRRHRAAADNPV